MGRTAFDLKDKGFSLRVCSWNVAETDGVCEGELLRKWLLEDDSDGDGPDLIVVGLQEVDMSSYAMCLGCCLFPTWKGGVWKDQIGEFLHKHGYRLESDSQMMGLMTLLWVKRAVFNTVGLGVATSAVASGFFGVCGNKGGLSVRVMIPQQTGPAVTICFVHCHLAAKMKKIERRNRDYEKIMRNTAFGAAPKKIMQHDYVFWFGDLNYRLEAGSDEVVAEGSDKMNIIRKHDQLYNQMTANRVFTNFKEPRIIWPPSYKILKNSRGLYDAKRDPSYCDRILHHHSSYAPSSVYDGLCESNDSPLLQYSDVEMTSAPTDSEAPSTYDIPDTPLYQHPHPPPHQYLSTHPIVPLIYTSVQYAIEKSDHRPIIGQYFLPQVLPSGVMSAGSSASLPPEIRVICDEDDDGRPLVVN